MLIEKGEVSQRYLKGREFTFSQAFRKLTDQEQTMLRKQLDAMEQYLYLLTKRIELARISEAKAHETESMLESLIGMKVIDVIPGKCDTCPNEPTDCTKLELEGGSYICLRDIPEEAAFIPEGIK